MNFISLSDCITMYIDEYIGPVTLTFVNEGNGICAKFNGDKILFNYYRDINTISFSSMIFSGIKNIFGMEGGDVNESIKKYITHKTSENLKNTILFPILQ